MALHAAAMIAGLVDQLAQAPIVVQCAQTAPDSWWKWLLQFAISVVPVAGGVAIAVWSFRAASRREHERWVLDQKVAEWRSLIMDSNEAISQIHEILSKTQIVGPFDVRSPDEQRDISNKFREALASGRKLLQGQIFIRQVLLDSQMAALWDSVSRVLVIISMRGAPVTSPEDIRTFTDARDNYFHALYRSASSDLALVSGVPSQVGGVDNVGEPK